MLNKESFNRRASHTREVILSLPPERCIAVQAEGVADLLKDGPRRSPLMLLSVTLELPKGKELGLTEVINIVRARLIEQDVCPSLLKDIATTPQGVYLITFNI